MASLKIDLKAYLSGILHILFSHTPSSLTAELAMALVAPPTANVSTTNISFTSEYLDQDHSGGLLATSVLFIVIDISVVALRFVSRRLNKTPLGRDDFMSVPALFFCLTVCAMGIVMIKAAGVGRHKAALELSDPEKLIAYMKTLLAVEFLYVAAFTCAKLTILALYLRVFTLRPYRISAYIIGSIVLANWVAAFLLSCLKCTPFEYTWDLRSSSGHCNLDRNRVYQWITFPSIVTDVMMLILPMRIVWKLQLPRLQKLGLASTFLTGGFGLCISIVRFSAFALLPKYDPGNDIDSTYSSAPSLMIWTIVESSTYLAASCFPVYRALFQRAALRKNKTLERHGRFSVRKGVRGGNGPMGEKGIGVEDSRTQLRLEGRVPSPSFREDESSLETKDSSIGGVEGDLEAEGPSASLREDGVGAGVGTDAMRVRSG